VSNRTVTVVMFI